MNFLSVNIPFKLVGYRGRYSEFNYIEKGGNFWSASRYDSIAAWYRNVGIGDKSVDRHHYRLVYRFSVRLFKDEN